jgi:hypothetical protein
MADWQDAPGVVDNLVAALRSFDWTEAEHLCEGLVSRINDAQQPFPEKQAKLVLKELRRKRQTKLTALVADALMGNGRAEAEIQRQYAQALIEQANLNAAERILKALSSDSATPPREISEARGLLGRVCKQRYVDAQQPQSPKMRAILEQGVRWYYDVYAKSPDDHLWHGINAVALLALARRHEIALAGPALPRLEDLATQILAILERTEAKEGELKYWDRATSMEAHIALGRFEEAKQDLREYMYDGNTDAFECNSTLRQLREVWQIPQDGGPGSFITGGLQAALLKRSGGELELQSDDVSHGLQLNFSAVNDITFQWWDTGLKRCAIVGRVEDLSERRVGTGVLVRRGDFIDGGGDEPALLTNWHVISEKGEHPLSIRPDGAVANFEACHKRFRVSKQMLAYSRKNDASLVALDELSGVGGHCPIEPAPAAFDKEKQRRVYVIGYPGGRGLSFSIHDSIWLDTDDARMHYRTPTEPGSSGSPVFDQDNWVLIGLHHAGKQNMKKLNGQSGTYQANEGMRVDAIIKAFAANPKS